MAVLKTAKRIYCSHVVLASDRENFPRITTVVNRVTIVIVATDTFRHDVIRHESSLMRWLVK